MSRERTHPRGVTVSPLRTKSRRLLAAGLALASLLAVEGCKVEASKADAATAPAGKSGKGKGGSAPRSSATGEYAGLKTGKVETGDVSVLLPEVGTLAPETKVQVKSVLSGRIVKLLVEAGDVVKAGQPLALLEPGVDQLRELSAITSGVESAELELKDAKIDYDNTLELSRKGFASQDQVKAAEKRFRQAQIGHDSAVAQRSALAASGVPLGNAAAALKSFHVIAPAAGVVLEKRVEIGEVVVSGVSGFNAGTVLFEIADTRALKVDAFVNEVDLGKIGIGYPVKISVDAFRGQAFDGEVATIAPAARKEGEIRGFDVEVRLKGEPGPLRPGMTANLDIRGDEKKDVLRIPVQSLFKDKGDDVVWTIRSGRPERTVVKPGLVSLEWVEVVEGVEAGAEVALESPATFLEEKKERERRRR